MIYVDLPVTDLEASKRFFGSLGFQFHSHFSDDCGACMIVDDDLYVMLLPVPAACKKTSGPAC